MCADMSHIPETPHARKLLGSGSSIESSVVMQMPFWVTVLAEIAFSIGQRCTV